MSNKTKQQQIEEHESTINGLSWMITNLSDEVDELKFLLKQSNNNFEMLSIFKMKDMLDDLHKFSSFYYDTVENSQKSK